MSDTLSCLYVQMEGFVLTESIYRFKRTLSISFYYLLSISMIFFLILRTEKEYLLLPLFIKNYIP